MTQQHELVRREPGQVDFTDRGLVPRDLKGAMQIAHYVVKAGIAPRTLNTPEKVCMAIAHGAEIGLSAMQSLQVLCVINGQISIYGDGLPGLVLASGKCIDYKEWNEGSVEEGTFKAYCRVGRKDVGIIEGDFDIEDAKRARVWGKQGPWSLYPKRMLKIRARAFAMRDLFADVLGGLTIAEEQEDIQADRVMNAQVDGREVEIVKVEAVEINPREDPIASKLGIPQQENDNGRYAQFEQPRESESGDTQPDAPAEDQAAAAAQAAAVTGMSTSEDIPEKTASEDTVAVELDALDRKMGRGKYPELSWRGAAKEAPKWMAQYIANHPKVDAENRELARAALVEAGHANLIKHPEEHWTKTEEGKAAYALMAEAFESLGVTDSDAEGFIKTSIRRDGLTPLSGADLFAEITREELDRVIHELGSINAKEDTPEKEVIEEPAQVIG